MRKSDGAVRMWELEGVMVSTRVLKVMDRLGVTRLDQLATVSRTDLARIKDCGPGTIKEIIAAVSAPRRSLRERKAEWLAAAKAIRRSRNGCDCPNYINDERVRASERCNATWVRCNGVLPAQSTAMRGLGPEPTR